MEGLFLSIWLWSHTHHVNFLFFWVKLESTIYLHWSVHCNYNNHNLFLCLHCHWILLYLPYGTRESVQHMQESIFQAAARTSWLWGWGFGARTIHGNLISRSGTGGSRSMVKAGGSLWLTTSWNQTTSASSTWRTPRRWRWTSTLSGRDRCSCIAWSVSLHQCCSCRCFALRSSASQLRKERHLYVPHFRSGKMWGRFCVCSVRSLALAMTFVCTVEITGALQSPVWSSACSELWIILFQPMCCLFYGNSRWENCVGLVHSECFEHLIWRCFNSSWEPHDMIYMVIIHYNVETE